jgi:hypothetical protein
MRESGPRGSAPADGHRSGALSLEFVCNGVGWLFVTRILNAIADRQPTLPT